MANYLPFVYTRDEDDEEYLDKTPRDIHRTWPFPTVISQGILWGSCLEGMAFVFHSLFDVSIFVESA